MVKSMVYTFCFIVFAINLQKKSAMNIFLFLGRIVGVRTYESVFFFFFLIFYFAHTNNYNTLHLQFITGNCYRLQKKEITKKKGRTKSTKYYSLYINN